MSRVTDRDRGYRRALAALRNLENVSAVVGIRQEKGADKYHASGPPGARVAKSGGDLTLAEVATVLEYGTDSIPERPFLRDTFDANRARYGAIVERGVRAAVRDLDNVADGLERAVELTAIAAVGDVQQAIATPGAFAPNAPATIARKGSSMPLIDTGRLRQSIDYGIEHGDDRTRKVRP